MADEKMADRRYEMQTLLGEKLTPGLISMGYFLGEELIRLIGIETEGLIFSRNDGQKVFGLSVKEANEKLSLDDPNYNEEEMTFVQSWI